MIGWFDRFLHMGKYNLINLVVVCIISFGTTFPIPQGQNPAIIGNTYYVSPSGSDNSPGTYNQPWKTIQKAADTMVAGDIVYIRTGTYPEQVIPKNSGTLDSSITYSAYPGETPTLDGSSVDLPDNLVGLFDVTGMSYLRITGLRVVNVTRYPNNGGILVKRSNNIIVENNYTFNTISSGIGIWDSQNIIVNKNRIEHANNSYWQECLTIAGTDSFEVSNNEVFDCGDQGIDVKNGSSNGKVFKNYVHHTLLTGIYVDAYSEHTYGIEVYQNLIHDISSDNGIALASEKGGLLEDVLLYNNIIYFNRYCGFLISRAGSGNSLGEHPVQNVRFINNTIYNNGWVDYGGGINIDNPDAQQIVLRNNIVSQNLSYQIAVDPLVPTGNVSIDHNLIYGFRGYIGETYGEDYVDSDPMFVNPAAANFQLQVVSPAIDAGNADGAPEEDFGGMVRPQAAGFDLGAFEFPALSKSVNTKIAHFNDELIYTLMIVSNGNPTTITDPLPSQLNYLDASTTCPGTVSYDPVMRNVQYDGTPATGSVCTIEIRAKVNTIIRMTVTNIATMDDGQIPIKGAEISIIVNPAFLYLPIIILLG